MERIPQSYINELIARCDIYDVINSRVPLKKRGHNYLACCPFHDEKTPSFTVSPNKQFFYCFGCGASGNVIGFLMKFDNLHFVEAIEQLSEDLGLPIPKELQKQDENSAARDKLYPLLNHASQFFQEQLRNHPAKDIAVDYLKQRGLSGEIAKTFALGFAPPGWDSLLKQLGDTAAKEKIIESSGLWISKDHGGHYDRFRNRVTFPIRDQRGRTIGFGGRVLSSEDEPKYLNSPETPVFHKGYELYGLYEACQSQRSFETILVVEGYMDVVALAQHGISYAVATLGTATTIHHLKKLFRQSTQVTFCFDGDRAGKKAAWQALLTSLTELRPGRQIKFLYLPESEDPDSLIRKEGKTAFDKRIQTAKPLSEVFIQQLLNHHDHSSLDGKAAVLNEAKPLIKKIPDLLMRSMLWQAFGERLNVSTAELDQDSKPDASSIQQKAHHAQRSQSQRGSIMRKTISLLVQQPSLAMQIKSIDSLETIQMPGIPLLVKLSRLVKERPDFTTGGLLAHEWDEQEQSQLSKLASMEHPIEADKRVDEFTGCIAQLLRQGREQTIKELLQQPELSPEDRAKLQQLITSK